MRPACPSSASPPPSSWRCSSGRAPAGCVTSSPRPRPPPLHRLRGRDRCRRPAAGRWAGRRQRRAGADPQPDPGRDGRLRRPDQRHRDRGHQPTGRPRPGPAATRPLRPPGHPRPAGHEGSPRDPGARQGQAARQGDRPPQRGQAVTRLLGCRPGQPCQRGRHPGGSPEQEDHRHARVPRGTGARGGRSGAQEPHHQRRGEGHHRLPRGWPRHGAAGAAQVRPRGQGQHHQPRHGPGLHHGAAHGGPLPAVQVRVRGQDRRHARWHGR